MSERLNNIASLVSKRTGVRVVYQVIKNQLVIGDTTNNTLIFPLDPVLDWPDTKIVTTAMTEYTLFLDKKLKEKIYTENCIYSWKDCKHKIKFRLINPERDAQSLQNRPYKHFLNLVKIYYIDFGHEHFDVNNDTIQSWKITVDELDKAAELNMNQEMIEIKTDKKIDITGHFLRASNISTLYGASILALPEFLQYSDNLHYNTEGNVYIIPFSAHELLICAGVDVQVLQEFVKAHDKEALSKRFYKYNSEAKNLIIV